MADYCPQGCIECIDAGICTKCSQDMLLFNNSCTEFCPDFHTPIWDGQSHSGYCRAVSEPLMMNGSLTLLEMGDIQDYREKPFDIKPIHVLEDASSFSICFWLFLDSKEYKVDEVYKILFFTSSRKINPRIGNIIDITVHKKELVNTLVYPQPIKIDHWNRICTFRTTEGDISLMTFLNYSYSKYSVKSKTNFQSGTYLLYIGGYYDFPNLPGKIAGLSISYHPILFHKLVSVPLFHYQIKDVSMISFSDLDYSSMQDAIFSLDKQIIGDFGLLLNGSSYIKFPIKLPAGTLTIRWRETLILPNNALISDPCGFFGLYTSDMEMIEVYTMKLAEHKNSNLYQYPYIVNKVESGTHESEYLLILTLIENELIVTHGRPVFYKKINISDPYLWLVIGAQPSANLSDSCPFYIKNFVIISNELGTSSLNKEYIPATGQDSGLFLAYPNVILSNLMRSKQCYDGCDKCEEKICLECQSDKVLLNGKCVESCPYGYKKTSSVCQFLSPFMLENSSCIEGYHLDHRKYCVKSCDPSFFAFWNKNTGIYECRPCSLAGCLECPNDICQKCDKNMYFDGEKCILYPNVTDKGLIIFDHFNSMV